MNQWMVRVGALCISLSLCTAAAQAAVILRSSAVGNCDKREYAGTGTASDWIPTMSGLYYYGDYDYDVACPIDVGNASVPTVSSIWFAYANVYDGHTSDSVWARLCYLDPFSGSYSCGATASTSLAGTGRSDLLVYPPTGTFGATWVADVWVNMHNKSSSGGSASAISGYIVVSN